MKENSYFVIEVVLSDTEPAEHIAESLRGLDGVKSVKLSKKCPTILLMPDIDYTSSHYVGLTCRVQKDDNVRKAALSTIREVGKNSVIQLQYYPVLHGKQSGKTTARKAIVQCIPRGERAGICP